MINKFFSPLIFAAFLFSFSVFAQQTKPTPKTSKATKSSSSKTVKSKVKLNEKTEFEKARAIVDPTEKIQAFRKFLKDFPKSTEKNRAMEIISSSLAAIADQKLGNGETEAGIQLFKDAVNEAPLPISENLFVKVILQFPTNLFSRGEQAASLQVAQLIETKIKDNPRYLIGLAAFYLGIERAEEARTLAEAAIAVEPNLAEAYQTLGLAQRLNFDLEAAEKSYEKALELAPTSVVSKRSLAELKRATGKTADAVSLYRELAATDRTAQNGLILSLFDNKQTTEAESLLNQSLNENPNNLFLLVGAAYWYAGNNQSTKAIDLAQKAIDIERRYTWAYIALARGQMLQNEPMQAEKTLLIARQYGNFPTLDYELATARFQAGLFEEAVRELKKRFAVKDGYVQTYIAGRYLREAESFVDLLGLERRASIFTPGSADTAENAEKLKNLLTFSQKVSETTSTEEELAQAADNFAKNDDKMKTHRQLYAASRLLDAKRNLPKVLELAQAAIKGVDESLEIQYPSAAIMADELLETRTLALSRDELVIIPDVPKQTLSMILRGRIEETIGWAFYHQSKPREAVVRLKRAVSILPPKSAWWRSSTWKLGLAYDLDGNPKEALVSLSSGYLAAEPDRFKRGVIENVYRKANGNLDGLDKLIGANPFPDLVAQIVETPTPSPTPVVETSPTPSAITEPTPEASPSLSPTPESPKTVETPTPEVKTEQTPAASPLPTPTPEEIKAAETPTPTPNATATPDVTVPEPTPTPQPATIENTPKADVSSTPKPLFEPVVITVPKADIDRPRVVSEPKSETPNTTEEPTAETASCIIVSQPSISILANGGSLGILVGMDQAFSLSSLKVESNSPKDVVATLEPDIGKQSNRAFYVIKSISENKGVFTVTLDSPCGKKEIEVKVR